MTDPASPSPKGGLLDLIERIGNRLPDPSTLFLLGTLAVILISALAVAADWTVQPKLPRPDLYPAGFIATWFAQQTGLESIVSVRGNDVDKLMFPPGDFARLRWTLERAGTITTVSRDLARKVAVLIGDDARVTVAPNAVDPETFSPAPPDPAARVALGVAPGELVLGFCGELRHKKGLPFLLDALVDVRRQRPACLLVIGEIRSREQARLAEFAHEHPEDASRLLVTGANADPARVATWLRQCDLFVMPSVWDGLPNALLEALACGLVVVTSDAGGIAECVDHGVTGFVVPKASLHKLGQALLEVVALPEDTRAGIGAAARRAAIERFHPDREREALALVLAAAGTGAAPSISS